MPGFNIEADVNIYNKLMTYYNTEQSGSVANSPEYSMDSLKYNTPTQREYIKDAIIAHMYEHPTGGTDLKIGQLNYRGLKNVGYWNWSEFNNDRLKGDAINFTAARDYIYNNVVSQRDTIDPATVDTHQVQNNVNYYDYNAHTFHSPYDVNEFPKIMKNPQDYNITAYPEFKYDSNSLISGKSRPLMWRTRQISDRRTWGWTKGAFTAYEAAGDINPDGNIQSAFFPTYFLYPEDPRAKFVTDVEEQTMSYDQTYKILKPTFTPTTQLCGRGTSPNPAFFKDGKPSLAAKKTADTEVKGTTLEENTTTYDGYGFSHVDAVNMSTRTDRPRYYNTPTGRHTLVDNFSLEYNDLKDVPIGDLKNQNYDTATCKYYIMDDQASYVQDRIDNFYSKNATMINPKIVNNQGKTQYEQIVRDICSRGQGNTYAGIQLPNVAGHAPISNRVCALVHHGGGVSDSSVQNSMDTFCRESRNKTMPSCRFFNVKAFDTNISTTLGDNPKVLDQYHNISDTSPERNYAGIKDVVNNVRALKTNTQLGYSRLNDNLKGSNLGFFSPMCMLGNTDHPRELFPTPTGWNPPCTFSLTVCQQEQKIGELAIAGNLYNALSQECTSLPGTGPATSPPPVPVPSTGGGGTPIVTTGPGSVGGGGGGGTPEEEGTPTTTTTTRTTTAPRATTPPAEKDTLAKIKDFFLKKDFQGQPNWVWFAVGGGVLVFLILLFVASSSRGGGRGYRRRRYD